MSSLCYLLCYQCMLLNSNSYSILLVAASLRMLPTRKWQKSPLNAGASHVEITHPASNCKSCMIKWVGHALASKFPKSSSFCCKGVCSWQLSQHSWFARICNTCPSPRRQQRTARHPAMRKINSVGFAMFCLVSTRMMTEIHVLGLGHS